ncbi:hypothetical protein [Pseudomonas koreensis]|jgi:hypothetical protein|uniref:hypothetical protein n=1 Tax=Pseudomonas koreensis TaxID=198620 RepID=UPI00320BA77B
MNTPIRNASSFTDGLKARRVHLNGLLTLLEATNIKATEIETLTIKTIKTMISSLDDQLRKRD